MLIRVPEPARGARAHQHGDDEEEEWPAHLGAVDERLVEFLDEAVPGVVGAPAAHARVDQRRAVVVAAVAELDHREAVLVPDLLPRPVAAVLGAEDAIPLRVLGRVAVALWVRPFQVAIVVVLEWGWRR